MFRRIAILIAILLVVTGGAIVAARWHWAVNNLQAEYTSKGWYYDDQLLGLFMDLDDWVARGCGVLLLGTFLLSLLFTPVWRKWRYAVYARIYAREDLGQPKPFWWRVLGWLLWLPLPFYLFLGWILATRVHDPRLSPFSDIGFEQLQGRLCGGGGLLRGTSGPLLRLGRFLWNHPISHTFFWSIAFAILTLALRVCWGIRHERRSPQYRGALLAAGRCWKCHYPIASAQGAETTDAHTIIVACPECGEPYQERIDQRASGDALVGSSSS